MRIGFLLGAPQIGGMERQAAILASKLHQRGHHVVVFFLCSPNYVLDCKIDYGDIEQCFLDISSINQFWRHLTLRQNLNNVGIEILQAYNLDAVRLGVRATKKKCSTLCVGSIMGTRFACDSRLARRLRNVLQFADAVTVEANVVKELLIDHHVCESQKISVIRNAIEVPENTIKTSSHQPRVLFAGTLKEVKDPECFIEAAVRLVKKGHNYRFTVAGDGPLLNTLQHMVKAADCDEAIEFLGKVPPDQVPYSTADLVISSSLREASSNTLLEALAHGVPVVATNVGGSSEIVSKGNCGILIDPHDTEGLERAIVTLLRSEENRRTLGQNGRRFVLCNYSAQKMIQLHLDLYSDLISSMHYR